MPKQETLNAAEFRRAVGIVADAKKAAKVSAVVPRYPKGANKTEQRMHADLDAALSRGEIQWFCYEALTFKLGDDCRYTPDFIVIHADGSIEAREVKGFWRDDAKVKIRVAAAKFVWITFAAYSLRRGEWVREQF